MGLFRIKVDVAAIAEQLNSLRSTVEAFIAPKMKAISIQTHAFIAAKANAELSGHQQELYMGVAGNPNLRWEEVAKGIWVVSLDPKAAWVEEGRPATFMGDWMLNSPKAKTAKDGSKYLTIPLKQAQTTGGKFKNPKAAYEAIARSALKEAGLSLGKLERHADGTPKEGVLHRALIKGPPDGVTASTHPGFFSAPRSPEMAAMTGLPAHGGHYNLQGLAVMQRQVTVIDKRTGEPMVDKRTGGPKTKWTREAVVFRVLSSKHKAEGRWMYPAVKGLKAFPEAADFAQKCVDEAIKELEEMIRQR